MPGGRSDSCDDGEVTERQKASTGSDVPNTTPVSAAGTPIKRPAVSVFLGYLGFGATVQQLPGMDRTTPAWRAAGLGLAVGIAFGGAAICRPCRRHRPHPRSRRDRRGPHHRRRPRAVVGTHPRRRRGGRLIMGAREAALFNGALPWVLAAVPAESRGRVAGWFGLSMWAGLARGPLETVAAAHLAGLSAAWTAIAALGVLSALIASTTRRQTTGQTAGADRTTSWRQGPTARGGPARSDLRCSRLRLRHQLRAPGALPRSLDGRRVLDRTDRLRGGIPVR